MSTLSPAASRARILRLCETALLVAIIVLMAFTPLGYLRMPGLEITFIQIPVVVGAILLGPGTGLFLGAVFGITSFFQCFGLSPFGAALLAINPWMTAIVCLVPRALMGWLCGLIFRALARVDKTRLLSFGAASLSAAVLNTVFFMAAVVLLFHNTDYILQLQQDLGATGILTFVVAFVGVNGLVEAIVCTVVGTAVAKALSVWLKKLG